MDPGPFESLLADLSRADVRYLVVGGVACVLNGYVRTTDDVDIVVERDPENIRRLLDVLGKFGEGHARELSVDDFTDEEGAISICEEFAVDVFTRMGGLRYADLLPYRAIERGPVPIPYVDAAGLIRLKSGSPRPQDKMDVDALRLLIDGQR
jgi:hypothetical protein